MIEIIAKKNLSNGRGLRLLPQKFAYLSTNLCMDSLSVTKKPLSFSRTTNWSKNVLKITAAKTKNIEANKLAHEINRTFIQADLDPIIVKHQNITVAMEKVALTMLTKHVQKFRESANTDTSSERQKEDIKYTIITYRIPKIQKKMKP